MVIVAKAVADIALMVMIKKHISLEVQKYINMMIKLKKIIIIIASLFFFLTAQSSVGGTPYSLEHQLPESSNKVTLPTLNIEQLLEEDRNAPLASPFRYGYQFDADLSLNNSGEWINLDNGDR